MKIYVNQIEKMVCQTEKEIKCPKNTMGVGEYESSEALKRFQFDMFLEEGFTKVTTKQFKNTLKNFPK